MKKEKKLNKSEAEFPNTQHTQPPSQIFIYGAGGAGREIIMLVNDINRNRITYEIMGFIDDNNDLQGKRINNIEVVGGMNFIKQSKEKLNIVMGIAEPNIKQNILNELKEYEINWLTLVHPNAYTYGNVKIGKGSVICKNSLLSIDVKIGDFVYINFNCTIPHDSIIENYASLMNNVVLSGNDIIEESVFIGSNSVIIQGKRVGKQSIIGAGSVVIRDVEDNTTVAGNPAKVLNKR